MKRHVWVAIGIGGGLGALAREGVSTLGNAGWFPLNFFTINIVGSFLIGIVMALSVEYELLPAAWRMFLGVGFLGGFTTFSTYMLGVHDLLRTSLWQGVVYLLGAWGIGLVAVYGGLVAVRSLLHWVKTAE
ncbi:MAG: CrcB family protein [Sulfobacillus thermotolerans]|uniref:Fluoride-specific ion channel FluC n=1 Tax=Sulfobacillus thermotolerans TaxID=338644 RepID=A0ABM6RRY0_9FIRM|nr:hypothetical protein BXT84_08860 [Sulfobacillus thermotolerans]MCY0909689.1 CrcB family protein [Sulfobacillus thermotolerans]